MNEGKRLWRHIGVLGLVWVWSSASHAAPALSGDKVQDLEALQQRLASGETSAVMELADSQAERLAGGNAADRWARALYLQLAANAAARDDQPARAADWLAEARNEEGIDTEHRARWLRQEARLRLRDGQVQVGSELLRRWLAGQEGEAEAADLWLMAQAQASLSQWEEAREWVERAMQDDASPSDTQLSLAASVFQRTQRDEQALQVLDRLLARAPDDPAQWRRAAGLAQRLGDHGRAAALWEAGWRRGLLHGRDDLLTRVRLHVAGGTPARAAEILQAALDDGALEEGLEHRRLLAQAWEAARDRQRALDAWRSLAERSQDGKDWLRLGQMAAAWNREALAVEALRRAEELGEGEAESWLASLEARNDKTSRDIDG